MSAELHVDARVRVRDTVEGFAGLTGEIVDRWWVRDMFDVHLDGSWTGRVHTFRPEELEREPGISPLEALQAAVRAVDGGETSRQRGALPESVDPAARRGGGDPLANYLHGKGEGR